MKTICLTPGRRCLFLVVMAAYPQITTRHSASGTRSGLRGCETKQIATITPL